MTLLAKCTHSPRENDGVDTKISLGLKNVVEMYRHWPPQCSKLSCGILIASLTIRNFVAGLFLEHKGTKSSLKTLPQVDKHLLSFLGEREMHNCESVQAFPSESSCVSELQRVTCYLS